MNKIYVPNGCTGLEYMYIWYVEVIGVGREVFHPKRIIVPCRFIRLVYAGELSAASPFEEQQIGKVFSVSIDQLTDDYNDMKRLVSIQLEKFKREHFDGITRCTYYCKQLAEEMSEYQNTIAYNQEHILQLDSVLESL